MPASAILSAPAPLAGAIVQPAPEAGAVLPMAAFGALVDAEASPPAQPTSAAPRADPAAPLDQPFPAVVPAETLPAIPAESAGAEMRLVPVTDAESPLIAPVPGKPAAPSRADPAKADEQAPAMDVETAGPDSTPPLAGQIAPPAQLPPSAPAAPVQESAPPREEKPADEAGAHPGEAVAQPAANAPPLPHAAVSPAQPITQTALMQSSREEPDGGTVPEVRRAKPAAPARSAAGGPPPAAKDSAPEATRQTVQNAAAAPADVAASGDQPDNGLPSPLLTQTLAPVTSRPVASAYPQAAQAATHAPVVQAHSGRMGADIGVEIAKAAKGDREDLLIRLDPRDMGRVNVRLSFDNDGVLRAVMSADSPAALDMLRRESGELNRALADAGVRSDAQSLRFDTRSSDQGQGGGQGTQREQHARASGSQGAMGDDAGELTDPHYRPLRASGQVDLMA